MLSLNYLKAEAALAYYDVVTRQSNQSVSADSLDYYARKPGEWYGRGAKLLRLKGAVNKQHFEHLLNGRSPGGRQLIQAGVNQVHRPGYDYTFSAPKSFSVLAEVLAESELKARLYEAHEQAVKQTLAYFEKHYAQTRLTIGRKTEIVKTRNLVLALFTENTSRENEPQIHTHCVIMNLTRRPQDKAWRAIMNEPVHYQKMFMGQLYRNFLAKTLNSLGLSLERRSKGFFEISGVPPELLEAFSSRSGQIASRLEELKRLYPNMTEVELKALAAVATRKNKTAVAPDKLTALWLNRLHQLGYNIKSVHRAVLQSRPQLKQTLNHADLALQVLTEEESVLTKESILRTGLQLSLGEKTISELEQELKQSRQLRTIKADELYTTREIQFIEQYIVKSIQAGQGRGQAVLKAEAAAARLNRSRHVSLTPDQRRVAEFLLTSSDKIVGIQGDAGTGKTTLLQTVIPHFKRAGFAVVGLAPTAKAAAELRSQALPEPQTIDTFLLAGDREKTPPAKRLFVIDESSMLGSKKLCRLLQETKKRDRVILLGDVKQKQSLAAGGIFGKLQDHGVLNTVHLKENIRQQDLYLRAAVTYLGLRQTSQAFRLLDEQGKIHVVPERAERLQTAAKWYIESDSSQSKLVIVESNAERRQLNDLIHQQLLEQKTIGSKAASLTVRQPLNLKGAEKNLAAAYLPGDQVVFSEELEGLPPGTSGTVKTVDHENQSLHCQLMCDRQTRETKQPVTVDLKRSGHHLSVYRSQERSFAAGDRIVFLKNNRQLGLQNGALGTVVDISPATQKLRINLEKGDEVKFNAGDYPYFDHGYAVTDYKAQGQTVDEVIYLADTRSHLDFSSVYVAGSRARKNLEILTNDKELLQERCQHQHSKTSTLDHQALMSLEDDARLHKTKLSLSQPLDLAI